MSPCACPGVPACARGLREQIGVRGCLVPLSAQCPWVPGVCPWVPGGAQCLPVGARCQRQSGARGCCGSGGAGTWQGHGRGHRWGRGGSSSGLPGHGEGGLDLPRAGLQPRGTEGTRILGFGGSAATPLPKTLTSVPHPGPGGFPRVELDPKKHQGGRRQPGEAARSRALLLRACAHKVRGAESVISPAGSAPACCKVVNKMPGHALNGLTSLSIWK